MAGSGKAHLRPEDETLIRVEDLVVEYDIPGGDTVKAVSGISFDSKKASYLRWKPHCEFVAKPVCLGWNDI